MLEIELVFFTLKLLRETELFEIEQFLHSTVCKQKIYSYKTE